jgi:hypothetical protein
MALSMPLRLSKGTEPACTTATRTVVSFTGITSRFPCSFHRNIDSGMTQGTKKTANNSWQCDFAIVSLFQANDIFF